MTDTALKPCPFCGGDAELDYARSFCSMPTGKTEKQVAIYCTQCNADMCLCYSDHSGLGEHQMAAALEENWNRRDIPAPDTARFLATEDGEFNGNAPVPHLRLENAREHIARDMREGRFPTRSPVAFTFTDEVVHQVYLDLCIGLIDHEKVRLALNAHLLSAHPHPVETDVQPVAEQWQHADPISGKPVWLEKRYWNGVRSETSRKLIPSTDHQATVAALEAERDANWRDANWQEYLDERSARMASNNREFANLTRAEAAEADRDKCHREKEGLREALTPFARISTEGIAKLTTNYTEVRMLSDYFHTAARVLSAIKKGKV